MQCGFVFSLFAVLSFWLTFTAPKMNDFYETDVDIHAH